MAVPEAGESRHVQKVRKKLEKIIKEEHKNITPESLKEMGKTILKWITRHQGIRIDLKKRGVEIFDENKSPAPVEEKYIIQLSKQISSDLEKSKELPALNERVKKTHSESKKGKN